LATFESKVSDIFDENPRLARNIPVVIRKIFNESESEFRRRLRNEDEEVAMTSLMQLFDILYIDFYFKELNGRFLNWVIDRYSSRFTKPELDEIRAQSESHLDFYEIQDVFPGKGSVIKSLITGEEGFLRDVSSSRGLVKWDIILARCYRLHDDYYSTGSLSLFSQSEKKYILDRIEAALSEKTGSSSSADYADFAKNHWDIFFQIGRDIQRKKINKKYYTNYGELQLCEVRFQVKDLQAVLSEIEHHEDFNFVETKLRRVKKKKRNIMRYRFDWNSFGIEKELEAIKTENLDDGLLLMTSQLDVDGNPLNIELLGDFYIDPFLCRLETRSLELAEFAVDHFSQIFGDALVFKRIIKKNMNALLKSRAGKASAEPDPSEAPDPALVQNMMEKYYLDLLDKKTPALNNLTPREARQNPETLPLVIDWLKGMENVFERDRLNGKETISIEKLKKALDIEF